MNKVKSKYKIVMLFGRISNISRINEMPMNYSLVIEPFDCWGFDFMGP